MSMQRIWRVGRFPQLAMDAGTKHDPKTGQFTSGAAAEGATFQFGGPDHVVKKVEKVSHPEDSAKSARKYHVRGRWRQNLNQEHEVTLEKGTGRILEHHAHKAHYVQNILGTHNKGYGEHKTIKPAQSMRHKSVHAAIQEHIKEHGE